MSHLIKPENYHALLDLQQTEIAIKKIKDFFLSSISTELRLRRVTAPLFVLKGLGMNDDLNGVERPVTFPIKDMNEAQAEVVHSLAKWKRVTLAEYNVEPGYGIITDMNAIRADEEMDNLHSLYVDQWDWERVMPSHCRNTEYLKKNRQPHLQCHPTHGVLYLRDLSTIESIPAGGHTFHTCRGTSPALSRPHPERT